MQIKIEGNDLSISEHIQTNPEKDAGLGNLNICGSGLLVLKMYVYTVISQKCVDEAVF